MPLQGRKQFALVADNQRFLQDFLFPCLRGQNSHAEFNGKPNDIKSERVMEKDWKMLEFFILDLHEATTLLFIYGMIIIVEPWENGLWTFHAIWVFVCFIFCSCDMNISAAFSEKMVSSLLLLLSTLFISVSQRERIAKWHQVLLEWGEWREGTAKIWRRV